MQFDGLPGLTGRAGDRDSAIRPWCDCMCVRGGVGWDEVGGFVGRREKYQVSSLIILPLPYLPHRHGQWPLPCYLLRRLRVLLQSNTSLLDELPR
jgi:hypothetical protein